MCVKQTCFNSIHWFFTGRIDDRVCALQIGHGLGYDSLKGYVDDVSISEDCFRLCVMMHQSCTDCFRVMWMMHESCWDCFEVMWMMYQSCGDCLGCVDDGAIFDVDRYWSYMTKSRLCILLSSIWMAQVPQMWRQIRYAWCINDWTLCILLSDILMMQIPQMWRHLQCMTYHWCVDDANITDVEILRGAWHY